MGVRQLEGMAEEISLLHMNCEGCEWEMLENLLKHPDVMSKVSQVWTVKSVFLKQLLMHFYRWEVYKLAPTTFQRWGFEIFIFIRLISVGAEPEQAVLRDQRAVEFDPQDGVGGALCLGEMGQNRIGRKLLKIVQYTLCFQSYWNLSFSDIARHKKWAKKRRRVNSFLEYLASPQLNSKEGATDRTPIVGEYLVGISVDFGQAFKKGSCRQQQ